MVALAKPIEATIRRCRNCETVIGCSARGVILSCKFCTKERLKCIAKAGEQDSNKGLCQECIDRFKNF